MFFITTNDSLAVAEYDDDGDAWIRCSSLQDGQISQFVAGKDSKSLSVTEIPGEKLLLIYEDPDGLVAMIEGTSFEKPSDTSSTVLSWEWQDLTSKLHSSVPSIRLGSQFASVYTEEGFLVFFYGNKSSVQVFYQNGTFGSRS